MKGKSQLLPWQVAQHILSNKTQGIENFMFSSHKVGFFSLLIW